MSTLNIRLLGAFEVALDNRQISIPSRTSQALLAYLVLQPKGQIRREKIAGDIWPDVDSDNSRAYLRNSLWQLRKLLGADFFQTDKIAVGINPEAKIRLDVEVLTSLDLQKAQTDSVMKSLEEYRGELLPGFYDEWLQAERAHLNRVAVTGYQNLIDRLLNEGRWNEVITWAEKLVKTGEASEFAFVAMMKAYAGLGEMANVTQVYQRCIKELERELNVAPSPETKDLYEQLIQNKPKGKAIKAAEVTNAANKQPVHNLTGAKPAGSRAKNSRRPVMMLAVLGLLGLSTVILNGYRLTGTAQNPDDGTDGSVSAPEVVRLPAGFDLSQLAQHNSGKSIPISERKDLRVQEDGSIRVLSMNGQFSEARLENLVVKWASWAGDGKRILVLASTVGKDTGEYQGDYYIANEDGGDIVRLTFSEDDTFKGPPSVSSDGTRILFSDGSAVKILDLDNGTTKTIVASDGGLSWIPDARWSQDETKIVFSRITILNCTDCQNTLAYTIVNSDGTGLKEVHRSELSLDSANTQSIGFSPDGNFIGFDTWQGAFVIPVDGTTGPQPTSFKIWTWLPMYYPQWGD